MTQPPRDRWAIAPILLGGCALWMCSAVAGWAQSITPTLGSDGTGTLITPQGQQFTIQGGQFSQDGSNLFHSFQRFGLTQGQIATFLAQPQVRNILGRVTGGEPSWIDGVVRVSGGAANLYLMNPAGIVFGGNARLDVPASFTATTASGIGLGGDRQFQAIGTNDYAALVGTPQTLVFPPDQPGAIANFGQLRVPWGQSLSLIGGTVLNAGSLTAPAGQVHLVAVPGQTWVRLSHPDQVVDFEFQPLAIANAPDPLPFRPLTLPQLLTGGNVDHVNHVQVHPDGTVQLAGSTLAIPTTPGTAIASGTLSVASTVPTPASTQGITVLGTQVAIVQGSLDASGITGGGTIRVGGDYQGQGTLPRAAYTFVDANSVLRADAEQYGSGGQIIVWADQSTVFQGTASVQGGQLGGNGGSIETSGRMHLDVTGATIRATAPQGNSGTWLLDPRNVRIVDGIVGNSLSSGNPAIFTPTTDDAIVRISDIRTALNQEISVRITTGGDGVQSGNITLESPLLVNATGAPTLSLEAANDIVLNQTITSAGALNLVFTANQAIALNAPVRTDGGNVTTTSQTIAGVPQINTSSSTGTGTVSITTTNTGTTALPSNPTGVGDVVSRPVTTSPTSPNTPNSANTPNSPIASGGDRLNTPGGMTPPEPGGLRGGLRSQPQRPGSAAPQPGSPPGSNQSQGEWRSPSPQRSEQAMRDQFLSHFKPPRGNFTALPVSSENTLSRIQLETGVKPALIYLRFSPALVSTMGTQASSGEATVRSSAEDQLELVLVTGDGNSVAKRVAGASREQVSSMVRSFLSQVSDIRNANSKSYLSASQALYRWLIAPLESELAARSITNLTFIAETGLRFIPLAALHDGKQFLVEKYSVGLMPTLSLTDTRYVSLKEARILAAGASTFNDQPPLPAVPMELAMITQTI